jgi:hypothetical protein
MKHRVVVISLCQLVCSLLLASAPAEAEDWYSDCFWLLHEDHHTGGAAAVGRDADLDETTRLLRECRPDLIQIHAKGNPGWTTYPSRVGHTPPHLARDVLRIWEQAARRDHYRFSVYFNLGRDGEIMQRHPEWNRVQADGTPVDRALCYHSGVAEAYLGPMIREIVDGYHPDGFWFDGSCFTVRTCYCPACRQRFTRQTNRTRLPAGPGEPGWAAFKEMQREIYRECIRETCREIHQRAPDCLVAVNWAYSLRMPEKPDPGIAYLTGDIGNRVEGLSLEAHWYDSTGLPFDLMTQINTLQPSGVPHDAAAMAMRPKPARQIQQEMAVIIANGGRYFAWDTPTPESGLSPERFEFMGRVIEPFLRSRQPFCLGTQRVPDVSVLHSAAAHYAVNESAATCFSRRDNRLEGAAEQLTRMHLNYELVPDWRLHEGDVRSPLLIVEHAKRLDADTVQSLIRYARQGGRLLLTGMTPYRDPPLQRLSGVVLAKGPAAAEPLSVKTAGGAIALEHWLFRVRTEAAQTLLEAETRDASVVPLLTANQVGQGTVYTFAAPLLSEHGENVIPEPLLRQVFAICLPEPARRLSVTAPATVEAGLREREGQQIVHLVNMAAGERATFRRAGREYTRIESLPPVPEVQIRLRLDERPAAVNLQPQGTLMEDWRFDAGVLRVTVPEFDVHQIVVVTTNTPRAR